jgi:hypothetical protein
MLLREEAYDTNIDCIFEFMPLCRVITCRFGEATKLMAESVHVVSKTSVSELVGSARDKAQKSERMREKQDACMEVIWQLL